MVKKTAFKPPDPPTMSSDPKNIAKAVALKQIYSTPKPAIDMESGEPIPPTAPNDYETENILHQASMYEAAGVGLSRSEMYGVMLCLKKLGENPDYNIDTVRFFGKMLGTEADYYVFESTLKAPGPEITVPEGETPVEPSGEGANRYTYWVCTYVGGAFTRLPDCTPTTMRMSRQIKKYLTGRLDAYVTAYPAFPGTEADYLRAQVGRIASATVVCPAGYFKMNEDGTVEKNEEHVARPFVEQLDLANWAHRYPHIKEQGRCEFYAPPPPDVGEDEDPPEEPEPETSPELLSTLDLDADSTAVDWGAAVTVPGEDEDADPTTEGRPAWATCTSSNVPGVQYQVVCVKSLVWPGAAVVYSEGKFANCYVGYGFHGKKFVPPPPPPVAEEFDLGGQVVDEETGEEAPRKMVMSTELPAIPDPEPEEDEADGDAADDA